MVNRIVTCVGLGFALGLGAGAHAAEEVKTDMSKGGITLSSGVNSLTIGGRVQFRYTADDREDFDGDTIGPGLGDEDGPSDQYAVQRMRLTLKGGMWRTWLKYEFQFELANTSGSSDNKIKDAVIEIDKHRMAVLKVGQFKTPFSLQQLISSGRFQFVDRAITDSKFVPGRDQGVMLTGLTESKKFGYSVGAFNGSGESRPQEDQSMLSVARVWFDPLGEYRLAESANDGPEKHVLHFGLGARSGEAQKGAIHSVAFEEPDDETAVNVEAAWKYRRFSAAAEYFMMNNEVRLVVLDPNGVPTGALASADDIDSSGWYAQLGVMLTPKTIEVGARYAKIDPDDDVIQDSVTEARLVFSYYFQGHNLKVQADAGQISFNEQFGPGTSSIAERGMPSLGTRLGGAKDRTDTQVRAQMQVAF